jgi:hypothetical protein
MAPHPFESAREALLAALQVFAEADPRIEGFVQAVLVVAQNYTI